MPAPIRSRAAAVSCAALVALAACTARAQAPLSTNLNWDHCVAEGEHRERSFACDNNRPDDFLTFSIVLHDSARTRVNMWEAMLDVALVSDSIPSWWRFGTGGCRATGLTMQTDGTIFGLPESSCPNLFGEVPPLQVFQTVGLGADRFSLRLVGAVPDDQAVTLQPEVEYVLCLLRLSHYKTTGAVACAGCPTAACFGAATFTLTLLDPGRHEYYAGAGQNTALWQGGYVEDYPTAPGGPDQPPHVNRLGCISAAVPAHGRTWGMIKTLYR